MRLIGKISDIYQAREFSAFLKKEGIDNDFDVISSSTHPEEDCQIWIFDEDKVEEAKQLYTQFLENPTNPRFYGHIKSPKLTAEMAPPRQPSQPIGMAPIAGKTLPIQRNPKGIVTLILLLICIGVFIWEGMSMPSIPTTVENTYLPSITLLSEAQKDLMYDYPRFYELAAKIYRHYTPDQIQNPANAPAELNVLLKTLHNTPYWQGAYTEFFLRYKNPALGWSYHGPLFEKISEGELWRLVTPIVLHADFFHILFNVIWLMVLGNQIEKRIGALRYIVLIIASAIVSNTAEYLMSGPNFLGLSGVVCAMAGFIWSRQQKAPWEGYFLHRSTMLFITLFVFAMLALQLVSFFLELFGGPSISPGIANTAHLTGGFFGFFVGRMKFFTWSPRK